MRPALDQLEALLWISRLGSFRSAARKLRLSQPAVSSRIRELESQLGFPVLDRTGHRPRVTVEGLEVVRYAEQMLGLAESFRHRLARGRLLASSIRMGAADSFALTYLSALLRQIAEIHPGTRVEVDVDFSAKLDSKLLAGELDIAFLRAPTSSTAVTVEPLIELDLWWLASPRLRLPKRRLRPSDLQHVPIITNPRPSHLYRTILDWFSAEALLPRHVHTCTSLTMMGKLTADGFGIAVLPPILFRRELARGRLVRLVTAPGLSHDFLAVAYRTDADDGTLASVANLAHMLVAREGRR